MNAAVLGSDPPRPWRAATLCALLAAIVLICLGNMLQLPGPGRPPWARADILVGWTGDADVRAAIVRYWTASSSMKWLIHAYLVVDALLFIPLYSVMLTRLRGRLRPDAPRWLQWPLGRAYWRWPLAVAAVADLLENVLCWALLEGHPVEHALRVASFVKWAALAVLVTPLLAAGTVHLRTHAFDWPSARRGLRRFLEGLRDTAEYLWRYAIPLVMLFGAPALLTWLPQTREIITDFGAVDDVTSTSIPALVSTAVLLIVWVAATGLAFSLVRRAIDAAPGPGHFDAAVLGHAHQWMVGSAALAAATTVLQRMAAEPSEATALFFVVGNVCLWGATTMLCTLGARLVLLPAHASAQPVTWRAVAFALLLLALYFWLWRFFPVPSEDAMRAWGWYRKPNLVWHFSGMLVDRRGLILTVAAVLAGLAIMGPQALRAHLAPRQHARLQFCGLALGLLLWFGVTWSLLGAALLIVQFSIIVLASIVLWVLTHRTTWMEYSQWLDQAVSRIPAFNLPPKLTSALEWLVRSSFNTKVLFRAAAGLLLLFFLLPHSRDPAAAAEMGTLAVVLAALAFGGLLFTWLFVYLPMRHGLGNWTLAPVLQAVVVGLLPSSAPLADRMDNPSFAKSPGAPTLHTHFAAWRELLPDRERSPVFMVAAAGGGLRAAYWTATLLAEMDDRTCGQFGRHVLAGSGVSGGSLGLALYAAQRRVWQDLPQDQRCTPGRAQQMRRVLSGDFLAPVAAKLLFTDAPLALVPFFNSTSDRSAAIGRVIVDRWSREFAADSANAMLLERPFRGAVPALFATPAVPQKATAAHPLLYLNATSVETGRRVVASSVTLGTVPADPLFYEDAVSRGMRVLTARTSLLDAALHSARFPGVSPAGPISACSARSKAHGDERCTEESPPYGLSVWTHLLDGGYFENSGLETLGDVLTSLQRPGSLSVHKQLPPFFLIAISNDRGTRSLCPGAPTARFPVIGRSETDLAWQQFASEPPEASPTWRADAPNGGLSAALKALLSVREGRARLELQRSIARFGCPYVLEWALGDQLQPNEEEPALGWMLSATSMRRMDTSVKLYADRFPFDLAACPISDGPPPRGLLGAKADQDVLCR